jgi:hypothetical protein
MELTRAERILGNILYEAENGKNCWKFLHSLLSAIYEKLD